MSKGTKLLILLGVGTIAAVLYFAWKGRQQGSTATAGTGHVADAGGLTAEEKTLRFQASIAGNQANSKADRFTAVNPKSLRFL